MCKCVCESKNLLPKLHKYNRALYHSLVSLHIKDHNQSGLLIFNAHIQCDTERN